jgi:signal transduction histidine kinase/DNA-binding response OmpR family regulator/HPt (histidine-containing phosphotransfer) domain-containing protein
VLIVDDDPEVHDVTRLALESFTFMGRPLAFLSAYSGREAIALLDAEDDLAVILLDVVMETDDAGLRVVRHARDRLGIDATRIILRTGQPGQAPEHDLIVRYDISDYKSKTELTLSKLYTVMVASLRSYEQIQALKAERRATADPMEAATRGGIERAGRDFATTILDRLLAKAETWVWILDDQGRFLSPGAAPAGSPPHPTAFPPTIPGAAAGLRFVDLVDGERDGDHPALLGALAEGRPFSSLALRVRGQPEDGEDDDAHRWYRASAIPRIDGDPTGGWVGLCHPMAREKALERSLKDARTQAEASTQAKYRFLATMSHELRTPMTSILGASQLLTDGAEAEERLLFLKTIREAGRTMMGVLNDIIDLAKVEDGKLEPAPEPTRLASLAEGVAVIMAGAAESKGLTLEVDASPDLPPVVALDSVATRRILLNLLGNAVKFTSAGRVTLTIRPDGQVDASNRIPLAFAVSDTGIGIPEALHESIFDPFSQVDPLVSRGVGGSGLGLTISRRLAQSLGGSLSVRSRPGRGSTFTLRLEPEILTDALPAEPPSDGARAGPRARPLRILLAEDVALNRTILTRMIERDGHRVRGVGDGAAAVAALAMDRFDVVLMDTRMPGMDGLEATRRIRALADPVKAGLPILALTANVLPEDAREFRDAGMDGVLHKPLDMEALDQALVELFGAMSPDLARPAPPPVAAAAREAPAPPTGPALVNGAMIATYVDMFGVQGVRDLVAVFEAQGTGMAQSLRDHLREGEIDNLIDTAHRLTSAAGSLALDHLRNLARGAEDAARDGRFADLDPLVNTIPLVVAQSLTALRDTLGQLRREANRTPPPAGGGTSQIKPR